MVKRVFVLFISLLKWSIFVSFSYSFMLRVVIMLGGSGIFR